MISISLNKKTCLDPYLVQRNFFDRVDNPDRQFLDLTNKGALVRLCNRFTVVDGGVSSYGYFAMRREDAEILADAEDITLLMQQDGREVKYEGLIYVKGTSLAPTGLSSDKDDVFVVEVADRRCLGNHPWLRLDSPGLEMFNVVAGAYGVGIYYKETTDLGDVPFTWQTMFDELWPPWLADDPPALAKKPAHDPVNFDFRQYSGYAAIQLILSRLDQRLSFEPDGSYAVYELGKNDALTKKNEDLMIKYEQALDEDIEWLDPIRAYYPKGVNVYFQRTATLPGCENAVTRESGQWFTDLAHVEVLNADDTDVSDTSLLIADTYQKIWDDLPAWTNPFTGEIYNQADITARALERKNAFYKSLMDESFRLNRIYSALIPFRICGTTRAVSWFQVPQRGGAFATQIVCHPREAFKIEDGMIGADRMEAPSAPWSWKALPLHPPRTAIVKPAANSSGSGSASASGSGSGCNLDGGTIMRYNEGGPGASSGSGSGAGQSCSFHEDITVSVVPPNDGEVVAQLAGWDHQRNRPIYFTPSGTSNQSGSGDTGPLSFSFGCPDGTVHHVTIDSSGNVTVD